MRRQLLFLCVAVFAVTFLSMSSIALAQTITLQGTIRDFNDTHPDFEDGLSFDPGIVLPDIGGDKKPVYAGSAGNPTTHGQTAFDQWYRDTPGVNQSMPFAITLAEMGTPGIFEFWSNSFFPVDGQLLGNQGRSHNYHFTYEIHTTFTYSGGESFTFTGDDDLWVFLNGKLAIDLGGVHGALSATVDLDAQAAALGLVPGNTYDFDLFFAERHTTQSNFHIQTTIALVATGPVLDIKPTSCPNPLNVKIFQDLPQNAKSKKGGVLPVAVLGSDEFDVQDIDVSSLLLEGVAPIRDNFEDVATPADGNDCDCTTDGPDGFTDLTLKFRKSEVAAAIGAVENGDLVVLTLSGFLLDGTPFEAPDCLLIRSKDREPPTAMGDNLVLGPAAPNPFNPVTRISYILPHEGFARLSVYDVAGRLVDRLTEKVQPAGEHVIEWNATGLQSGVYFYRLEFGGTTRIRKMILLK